MVMMAKEISYGSGSLFDIDGSLEDLDGNDGKSNI